MPDADHDDLPARDFVDCAPIALPNAPRSLSVDQSRRSRMTTVGAGGNLAQALHDLIALGLGNIRQALLGITGEQQRNIGDDRKWRSNGQSLLAIRLLRLDERRLHGPHRLQGQRRAPDHLAADAGKPIGAVRRRGT